MEKKKKVMNMSSLEDVSGGSATECFEMIHKLKALGIKFYQPATYPNAVASAAELGNVLRYFGVRGSLNPAQGDTSRTDSVFRNIYHLPGKEYASETEVIDFVKKKIAEQKYDLSKTL